MQPRITLGIIGVAVLLFSPVFVVPLVLAVFIGDTTVDEFSVCAGIAIALGVVCFAVRGKHRSLRNRDAFFIVTVVYLVLAALATLPFILISDIAPTLPDAMFEAASTITTTGATVLTGLDDMPKSLLFYRQLVCWFGGMGIIVLTVAILPMLGVGGMQLVKAEMPGDEHEVPVQLRVRDTAKTLWKIYGALTAVCALALWLAGMTPFDAIAHAFSTISIGGFSTHDANIGYFNNPSVEIIMMIFIVIAGCNFMLHYVALNRQGHISRIRHLLSTYSRNDEVRFYLVCLVMTCALVCFRLWLSDDFDGNVLREGLFHSISFMTTAGFSTTNLNTWPIMCPVMLLVVSFIGGCSGSTGGGLKVFRVLILFKHGVREIQQLIQPRAIFHARLNQTLINPRTLESVVGFMAVYAMTFIVILGLLMFNSSLDLETAFSAVAACLNNLGPGLGGVATNYQSLGGAEKCILTLAMILGRLEIFTILVLLAPRYWQR